MEIYKQLEALASRCTDQELRSCVEEMILKAAEYVEVVTRMETLSRNIAGRSGEALRSMVADADQQRHRIHDALIVDVDLVNRICKLYDLAPVYTGSSERREYGNFAAQLVDEIFKNRK